MGGGLTGAGKGDKLTSSRPEWSKKEAKKPFDYWELSGRSSHFPQRWSPKGFSSSETLRRHFEDHGESVGAKDAKEYEAQAQAFLTSPRGLHGDAFIAKNLDVFRYDHSTGQFAVATSTGTIKTYWNLGKVVQAADSYWERQMELWG